MKKTTLTKISKSIIATTLFLFCIGFSYGQSTTSNSKTSICPYCDQTIQIIGSTTGTPASGVIHNPLYEPIQTGGNNPLFESSSISLSSRKEYQYYQTGGGASGAAPISAAPMAGCINPIYTPITSDSHNPLSN